MKTLIEVNAFTKLLALGLMIGVSFTVLDAEAKKKKKKLNRDPDAIESVEDSPSSKKRVYIMFGAGYPRPIYTTESSSSSSSSDKDNSSDTNTSSSRTSFVLDLPGVYGRLGKTTLLGGVAGYVYDRSVTKTTAGTDVSLDLLVSHYSVGPSVIHFFSEKPAQGFFLRGDLMAAYSTIDMKLTMLGYNFDISRSSNIGYGTYGGLGYAFGIGETTGLILQGGASYRKTTFVNNKSESTLTSIIPGINLAIMF